MTVFRLCLRIIKANLGSMAIFAAIFVALSLVMSQSGSKAQSLDFNLDRIKVGVVSGQGSPAELGLKGALEPIAVLTEAPDDPAAIREALFFQSLDYVVAFPPRLEARLPEGEAPALRVYPGANGAKNLYAGQRINQYLNYLDLYARAWPEASDAALAERLGPELDRWSETALSPDGPGLKVRFAAIYYNFFAYSLVAVILLGVGLCLMCVNRPDLRRRNNCSPLPPHRLARELVLALLLYALAALALFALFGLVLGVSPLSSWRTGLMLLNALVLSLWALSLSFMLGTVTRTNNMLVGCSHVFTMVSSFVSGVFVPQALLGDALLRVARFLPVYWYVLVNDSASTMTGAEPGSLRTIAGALGMQALFAAAFLCVGLVLNKRKARGA